MENKCFSIYINRVKVISVLGVIVILLILLSLAGTFSTHILGHGYLHGILPKIDLDTESNIPTWFSSMLLFFSAILSFVIGLNEKGEKRDYYLHWFILSFIFLFFSLDESAQIHELMIVPLRSTMGLKGIFYFAWVLPGIIGFIVITGIFIKFFLNLPTNIKHFFLIAFCLYFGGALGVEFLGGYYSDTFGENNITYNLITTLEESLELFGSLMFIFTLLKNIELNVRSVKLDFLNTMDK